MSENRNQALIKASLDYARDEYNAITFTPRNAFIAGAEWQAAQAALMPVLVEARDAIIEARRNIDAVDNALADAFMWDALARLNTIIGEK